MKVSELYGKKAVSTNGKRGYVLSLNAAGGKIESIVLADENEREFTVDVQNILSVGEEIVFEDRESAQKAAKPIRLGRAGFDERGKFLGFLEELTLKGFKLSKAKIGKKNYPADGVVWGDVIIVGRTRRLKCDVLKDGKVILKKGTVIDEETMSAALETGEYVQTTLKSL